MDYFVSELQIVLPVLGVNEAWFPPEPGHVSGHGVAGI